MDLYIVKSYFFAESQNTIYLRVYFIKINTNYES